MQGPRAAPGTVVHDKGLRPGGLLDGMLALHGNQCRRAATPAACMRCLGCGRGSACLTSAQSTVFRCPGCAPLGDGGIKRNSSQPRAGRARSGKQGWPHSMQSASFHSWLALQQHTHSEHSADSSAAGATQASAGGRSEAPVPCSRASSMLCMVRAARGALWACSAGCITGLTRLVCITRQAGLSRTDDADTRSTNAAKLIQIAASSPTSEGLVQLPALGMPVGQQPTSSCQVCVN